MTEEQPRLITEVAAMLDVSTGTIRYWENQFADYIIIPRDSRGVRYYTSNEITHLRKVSQLRAKGLGFEAIRRFIGTFYTSDETDAFVSDVSVIPHDDVTATIIANEEPGDSKTYFELRFERLEKHNCELLEQVNKQNTNLESRLAERDRLLMETLRELQTQRQADAQRGFWSRLFSRRSKIIKLYTEE